jgi:hypothetical protein
MKNVLIACMAVVLAGAVAAAQAPGPGPAPRNPAFNLSLTPDIAMRDRTETIEGLTLSVWGENQQKSFALGIANGSVGKSAGLSLGVLNYAESYLGCQWGLVNYTSGDITGWQGGPLLGLVISVANYTEGDMKGVQTGLMNYAGNLTGLQIGVLNYAENADAGVQIGVVNIIRENAVWFHECPSSLAPGMVLVNWRF